ncbi:hypothetical protein ASPFODRAFT_48171 [Aspergillus luchuensis CBS 106.47]|uniref:Uncharacterized protein n=1 Tax=Aspergillus luchuensis (strain CBS 106.47) TaxID=1137211 RepID=A0A1M3TBQ4_ASPLC|nr:hypothetical protein ASPFODRAFT_48171 [Aspergillus luchuensis CBS 106.47]
MLVSSTNRENTEGIDEDYWRPEFGIDDEKKVSWRMERDHAVDRRLRLSTCSTAGRAGKEDQVAKQSPSQPHRNKLLLFPPIPSMTHNHLLARSPSFLPIVTKLKLATAQQQSEGWSSVQRIGLLRGLAVHENLLALLLPLTISLSNDKQHRSSPMGNDIMTLFYEFQLAWDGPTSSRVSQRIAKSKKTNTEQHPRQASRESKHPSSEPRNAPINAKS